MKAYLYCDLRSLNDATNYYIGIIKRSLVDCGYSFDTVFKLSEIKNADVILTITEKYFLFAKIRYPKIKTIYWSQGVSAEEAKIHASTLRAKLTYYFRCFAEPIAVKKSSILFCVSDRMVEYYRKEYGYSKKDNVIVMPCYNLSLSEDFNITQYQEPTFVYAGNASAWQSVDKTLDVFALVEKSIPNAKLVICTGNQDVFANKIKERGIKSYDIKYVKVDKLQDELHKYKYGLILREDHIINNVATPTKMNSYLAGFLIPIFSEAVDDFKKHINLKEFTLMAKCPLDVESIAKQIIAFEEEEKDYAQYQKIVKGVFNAHYEDGIYMSKLTDYIKSKL